MLVVPREQQAHGYTKCQANAYAHCQIIDDQTDGDAQRQSNSNASGVPVLHGHHLGLDQMQTIMDTPKRLLIMLIWRFSVWFRSERSFECFTSSVCSYYHTSLLLSLFLFSFSFFSFSSFFFF